MKSVLPFFALVLLLGVSCSKSEDVLLPVEKPQPQACNEQAKAIVARMNLNDSGSEHFYYLLLHDGQHYTQPVFAKSLSTYYQKEGQLLQLNFRRINKNHAYIVCKTGHNYDPNNPDQSFLPMIEVCTIEPGL